MSSICKSFESNAWRSDLCSHCFQSKEEHGTQSSDSSLTLSDPGSRYQSVLNHRSSYRAPTTTTAAGNNKLVGVHIIPTIVSILKSERPAQRNRKSVNFNSQQQQDADTVAATVIGYGGQECFEYENESDDDQNADDIKQDNEEQDDEDDSPFTEEERQIYNQTQKNTSFNSVSRNLLSAEVATFTSHGVSSSSSSAPLVTIRPFGDTGPPRPTAVKKNVISSESPKINLVSPMRNGQILVANNSSSSSAVEMKNRENLLPPPPAVAPAVVEPPPPPTIEKFTSFTEPTTRNSTLSRKPPVWKEKPRIPIKPQSVVTLQQQLQTEPTPPQPPQLPQLKTECLPGQISVRFVHLSQDPNIDQTVDDDVPSLIPVTEKVLVEPEIQLPEVQPPPPPPPPPPTEINNNPITTETKPVVSEASNNSTTRGLTRSAFEALRATVAGSLELSRMHSTQQSVRETKRPAPPTPTLESIQSDVIEPEIVVDPNPIEEPLIEPPVIAIKATSSERALSASPVYRNRNSSSSICQSPGAQQQFTDVALEDEINDEPIVKTVRSISLHRADSNLQSKAPSIRKMIKERTTKLLHNMADGSVAKCGSSRMSRSDRFQVEQQQKKPSSSKTASRFSMVRKFLGLKKDQTTSNNSSSNGQETSEQQQVVKVRPEIVHPIDFHPVGQVEVVAGKPDPITFTDPILDSVNASASDSMSSQPSSLGNISHCSSFSAGRPRPPPPPRQQSIDQPTTKPTRPPPPRTNLEVTSSEYANIGRVSPKKPERANSIRAKESITTLHYDSVLIPPPTAATGGAAATKSSDEDGYIVPMRIKSTPSFSAGSNGQLSQRHSLTSFMTPSDSSSSSTQSRPKSTYAKPAPTRTSRLDLHVKLEDHYGTVTGANFQALAQLLEQATSKRPLAQHFHELRREVVNGPLKWNAFGGSGDQDVVLLRTGSLTVLESRWRGHDLLLSVYPLLRQDNVDNKAPFAQPSVANFQDQVPVPFVPIPATIGRAGVEVFPPGQVATLKQLPHLVAMEMEGAERLQQSLCVVLQICRAVEWLQQQQHNSIRVQPEEIVFYREDNRDIYRLFWLTGSGGEERSVRDILSVSVRLLAPLLTVPQTDKLYSLIQQRADHVIPYLEFALFGPTDELMDNDPEPLDTFQRWLDVERASVLNELIRTQGLWRVKLSILEEFRLSFLVSTSPQRLLDTSHI